MGKVVCPHCREVHDSDDEKMCGKCQAKGHKDGYDFSNSDDFLKERAASAPFHLLLHWHVGVTFNNMSAFTLTSEV